MNWIKNRLRTRDDAGAVAIVVAICTILFCGFAAFAIDMSYAYAVDREHSVAADASALSGAQAVGVEYQANWTTSNPGCTPTTKNAVQPIAAEAAQQTYDDNGVDGENATVTTVVTCDADKNFLVTVTTGSEVDTFFAQALDIDKTHPGAKATAIVSGAPAYSGLRPFAVCPYDYPDAGPVATETYQTSFPQNKNEEVPCGTTSGQWGTMDFSGDNNQHDVSDWILHGYPYNADELPLAFPTDIEGRTGAPFNTWTPEINTLVNSTNDPAKDVIISLPVADGWTGGGNGAEIYSTGTITVKMCGYGIKGKAEKTDPSCWDDELFDTSDKNSPFTFQWKVMPYAPSYTDAGTGVTCPLTSSTCVPVIRLWPNPVV